MEGARKIILIVTLLMTSVNRWRKRNDLFRNDKCITRSFTQTRRVLDLLLPPAHIPDERRYSPNQALQSSPPFTYTHTFCLISWLTSSLLVAEHDDSLSLLSTLIHDPRSLPDLVSVSGIANVCIWSLVYSCVQTGVQTTTSRPSRDNIYFFPLLSLLWTGCKVNK